MKVSKFIPALFLAFPLLAFAGDDVYVECMSFYRGNVNLVTGNIQNSIRELMMDAMKHGFTSEIKPTVTTDDRDTIYVCVSAQKPRPKKNCK